MFELTTSLTAEIELCLVASFTLSLTAIHLWRTIRLETRTSDCPFCLGRVEAHHYARHLEICGLKKLSRHSVGLHMTPAPRRRRTMPKPTKRRVLGSSD